MAEKTPEPKTNTMKKKPGKGEGEREPLAHKHGDLVHFEHGDEEAGVTVRGKGKIVASGADGVTVATDDGREHKIRHAALRSGKATLKKAAPPVLIFAKAWPVPAAAAAAPRRAQSVPDAGTRPVMIMEKGGAYIGAHTRVSKNGVVTTFAPHAENRQGEADGPRKPVAKPGERHAVAGKHQTDAQRLLEEAREREDKAHAKHDEKHAEAEEKHRYGKDDGDGDGHAGDDEKDADGNPKKKKPEGKGKALPFVKKSDGLGMPVMVFGMVGAAATDAASAGGTPPAAPGDASLAGGNPPPLQDPPPAPREPESLADPRASYAQRAVAAFRSFWNPGK